MSTQNKNIVSTHTITLGNEEVTAYRVANDSNGNPRYVMHFLSLDIKMEDYGKIKGIKVYRPKWFGGGIVLESCYNLKEDAQRAYELVKAFYAPDTYASDLHRKGELKKVASMERLAKKMERESKGGLASAFVTCGYLGEYDTFGMLAQSKEYQNEEGHIVFSEKQNKAIFIKDEE
ncbi:hypothetical protein ACIQ1D_19595 [Lysinibacillus xylanilyticus]|uniref:hypothetical protein n=1 Tax=Lysinibacillus xylanilyticus TaxID=582475 RepID=UPI00381F177D